MLSIIQAAGWPIWTLIACSVLGLTLVIERAISLRTSKIAPPQLVDEAIQAQIHGQAAEADIRAAALAKGMQLMREDGERLIAQGIPSREEVLRVTRD